MIEKINYKDTLLAIILRNEFEKPGITFLTPDDFSQQLAYMHHPPGKKIQPHVHNHIERHVHTTNEVLFIKKGKLRVDFFWKDQNYISSSILSSGDTILLVDGGHGFEVLEDLIMIEVKQGPYIGDADKIRFEGVNISEINKTKE